VSKKYRIIFVGLMILALIGSVASLFLPYLVKLDIHSGDLTLPEMYEGYHYSLMKLILFIMLASVFSVALLNRQIITVVLSVIILILTYLVRFSIHYQGMVDHDYDSQTGIGFKLLFIVVLIHFIISVIAFIIERKQLKANATNTH
jgi:hypothetical protein